MFNRSANLAQLYYYTPEGPGIPPGESRARVIYLLAKGAADARTRLDFDAAWNNALQNCYIFLDGNLPRTQAAEQGLAEAIWTYLTSPAHMQGRFLWYRLTDPASGKGTVVGAINTGQTFSGRAAVSPGKLLRANYGLLFNVAGGIRRRVNTESFEIFANGSYSKAVNFTVDGVNPLPLIQEPVVIPLNGLLAGCVQACTVLDNSTGPNYIGSFDIGMRIYFDAGSGSRSDGGQLRSLRYPLLDEKKPVNPASGDTATRLYFNFDPTGLGSDREFVAFNPGDIGWKARPALFFNSNYATTLGGRILLTPRWREMAPTGSFARLLFTAKPGEATLSLAPAGDFLATVDGVSGGGDGSDATRPPGSDPHLRLMPGLSGVEYVGLEKEVDTFLTFHPGKPAHAGTIDPDGANAAANDGPTTSWAAINAWERKVEGSPVTLTYYSQPAKSVLYEGTKSAEAESAGSLNGLAYLEVPMVALPQPSGADKAFPLLPYAGVAGDADLYNAVERQYASLTRRRIILGACSTTENLPAAGDMTDVEPAAGEISAVTAQGLLMSFDENLTRVSSLVMAQLGPSSRFALTGIPKPSNLFNALQANQLFLVISDPNALKPYLPANASTITIGTGEGAWSFDMLPAKWLAPTEKSSRRTMVIFKYREGTLQDLADDAGAWVDPACFNGNPGAIRTLLRDTIAEGIANWEVRKNHDFQEFAAVARNPRWFGILILNAPIASFPTQMRGLAAGIDKSLFFGHHIGINASAIDTTGGPIGIKSSSLFGLVNYVDPAPMKSDANDYQYRVRQITVLFVNSQVAGFKSEVELRIGRLFGDPVTPQGETLTLNGAMQRQVMPDGTIADAYLFETTAAKQFVLQSGVLNAVQFNQAQLVTLKQKGPDSPLTLSRFVFRGILDFRPLRDFDLFSFGREPGAEAAAGLAFSTLTIDMSFDPDRDGSTTFQFNAADVAFDMAGSTARDASLASHFPLKLVGFTQGRMGTGPQDSGYMSVQSPLNQSSLRFPWYSLTFELSLGSAGALAGQVGFVANLIAAWSPGTGDYNVYVGLKLPGSTSGRREIPIQGVLKLTFGTIAFIVDQATKSYILILYNAALGFLTLSFPWVGQINIAIFGNPESKDNTTLGWYAAYAKPNERRKKETKALPTGGDGAPPLPGRDG